MIFDSNPNIVIHTTTHQGYGIVKQSTIAGADAHFIAA
jgi:hypothetical protein